MLYDYTLLIFSRLVQYPDPVVHLLVKYHNHWLKIKHYLCLVVELVVNNNNNKILNLTKVQFNPLFNPCLSYSDFNLAFGLC